MSNSAKPSASVVSIAVPPAHVASVPFGQMRRGMPAIGLPTKALKSPKRRCTVDVVATGSATLPTHDQSSSVAGSGPLASTPASAPASFGGVTAISFDDEHAPMTARNDA